MVWVHLKHRASWRFLFLSCGAAVAFWLFVSRVSLSFVASHGMPLREKEEPEGARSNVRAGMKRAASHPSLCVCFISCNRTRLLLRTLLAFYRHMNTYESHLNWECVLVDQATSAIERSRIASSFRFDLRILSATARGYGWPFNACWQNCRSKFVLQIEDDWEIPQGLELGMKRKDFVQEALDVLEHCPSALGTLFRHIPSPEERCKGPKLSLNMSEYTMCDETMFVMNGPSMYRREILLRDLRLHPGLLKYVRF